jgi:hypothetical protein
MRPNPAAADTIRTLIAAVPDDRLRELFLELALAALAVPSVEEPKPAPRNGRRRRNRGKGWRRGKSKHKLDRHSRAYLDALNAKRREERRLAREAGQAAPVRPSAAAANRRATAPRLTATARPSPPRRCGSTPASSSRGSPGVRCRANSASATEPPSLPTATSPCRQTSVPWRQPAFLHCRPEFPSCKGSFGSGGSGDIARSCPASSGGKAGRGYV